MTKANLIYSLSFMMTRSKIFIKCLCSGVQFGPGYILQTDVMDETKEINSWYLLTLISCNCNCSKTQEYQQLTLSNALE